MNTGGIIDLKNNPFSLASWIEQGFDLTPHRQGQLVPLFGKMVEEINTMNRNLGRCLAFVAIRWGFAEIVSDQLIQTDKWNHRGNYNGYGLPKIH
jgi:hypothetical protein